MNFVVTNVSLFIVGFIHDYGHVLLWTRVAMGACFYGYLLLWTRCHEHVLLWTHVTINTCCYGRVSMDTCCYGRVHEFAFACTAHALGMRTTGGSRRVSVHNCSYSRTSICTMTSVVPAAAISIYANTLNPHVSFVIIYTCEYAIFTIYRIMTSASSVTSYCS